MSAKKKDVIVVLRERAAKLEAERTRLDEATAEILQFTFASNDREREVMANFAKRMELTQVLENVLNSLHADNRGELTLSQSEKKSLTEQKKSLFDQLNELPPIGATQAEWDSINAEFKKKNVGRPSVSLEQKIIRVTKEFEDTINEIKKLSGTVDIDEIMSLSSDSSIIERRNGRPKHDVLGNLDTKLKNIQGKIAYITSGEHQRHVDMRLSESLYSEKGKRLGRSFEEPAIKLQRLRDEEATILNTISNLESKLQGDEIEMRNLKKLRDRRNELKSQLKGDISSSLANALNAELETVLENLGVLEAKIRGKKAPTQKFEKLHAREYEPVATQEVVQKPAQVIQHIRAERTLETTPNLAPLAEKQKEDDAGARSIQSLDETRESVTKLITRGKA